MVALCFTLDYNFIIIILIVDIKGPEMLIRAVVLQMLI